MDTSDEGIEKQADKIASYWQSAENLTLKAYLRRILVEGFRSIRDAERARCVKVVKEELEDGLCELCAEGTPEDTIAAIEGKEKRQQK